MKFKIGLVFTLFFSWASHSYGNSPYLDFLDNKTREIDFDGDGVNDLFRFYEGERLVSETFRLSSKSKFWRKVHYSQDGMVETSLFRESSLYKTEVEVITPVGYNLETTHHYLNSRTLKSVRGLNLSISRYEKVGSHWSRLNQSNEKLKKIRRDDATDIGRFDWEQNNNDPIGRSHISRQQREGAESDPIGFRLGPTCRGNLRDLLVKTTEYFFNSILPCLGSYHPMLAIALAENIKRHRTLLRCNQINSPGAAYTYAIRSADIFLQSGANPQELMNGHLGIRLSYTQAINNVANTLLHEALHNLGIVHAHGGAGKVDPAYGCENMCNTTYSRYPGLAFLDYSQGCRQCMATRVNGNQGDLNQCRR